MLRRVAALIGTVMLVSPAAGTTADGELSVGDISGFLAARSASQSMQYQDAAIHYMELLSNRPDDRYLWVEALQSYLAAGKTDDAVELAGRMEGAGISDFSSDTILFLDAVRGNDFTDAARRFDNREISLGPESEVVLGAWLKFGEGEIEDALAMLREPPPEIKPNIVNFHAGLALALKGDFEGAAEMFAGVVAEEGIPQTIISQYVMARAQTLVQLGRSEEAAQLLEDYHGIVSQAWSGTVEHLRRRITDDEVVEFDFIRDARGGIALFYLTVAHEFFTEGNRPYLTLFFGRFAEFLEFGTANFHYEMGRYLSDAESHQLSLESWELIGPEDATFLASQIARAEALERLGRRDEAGALLSELAAAHPEEVDTHLALGNHQLDLDEYPEAEQSYGTAITLLQDAYQSDSGQEEAASTRFLNWRPYYYRGIARERDGDWENAKSDFRIALELSGGNAFVLNYLGYSMLIYGDDVEEAEILIRQAVELEPENAAIADSLGWALFLQERYEEALPHLERSGQLLPDSAEVLDHLGDLYWMLGRKREAVFQWRRALVFDDEYVDEERVVRKIEVGLDEVLLEAENSHTLVRP
ncbi:MAG: tetratricopeptide repeat protein [Rhodobacteraceae bacterium]|nr:tetratricopeptide repeat protein [Paracoccaceae bacterium]